WVPEKVDRKRMASEHAPRAWWMRTVTWLASSERARIRRSAGAAPRADHNPRARWSAHSMSFANGGRLGSRVRIAVIEFTVAAARVRAGPSGRRSAWRSDSRATAAAERASAET